MDNLCVINSISKSDFAGLAQLFDSNAQYEHYPSICKAQNSKKCRYDGLHIYDHIGVVRVGTMRSNPKIRGFVIDRIGSLKYSDDDKPSMKYESYLKMLRSRGKTGKTIKYQKDEGKRPTIPFRLDKLRLEIQQNNEIDVTSGSIVAFNAHYDECSGRPILTKICILPISECMLKSP